MESLHGTYSTCIKSLVANVEQFLVDMDRNDLPITDETMINSLRTMSKTLQRILSKYDKNKLSQPKDQNQKFTSNSSSSTENLCIKDSKSVVESLFHESFLYRGQQDEVQRIDRPDEEVEAKTTGADQIRKRLKKEIDESDEEIEYSGTILHLDNILNPQKAISVKSLKSDNEDKNIVKCNDDTYECTVCHKKMNKNNVQSHLSGKSHRTKSRENSCVGDRKASLKKLEEDMEEKITGILEVVKVEFKQSLSGEKHITVRNCVGNGLVYYCNICKVEVPVSDLNLLAHVQGQTHRKSCQS